MDRDFEITLASYDSILIRFDDKIDEEILGKVYTLYKKLKSAKNDNILSIVPSYTTLLIRYKELDFKNAKRYVLSLIEELKDKTLPKKRLIKIPAYYGIEAGVDLRFLSKKYSISIKDIIKLHSNKEYLVYAVGFMPAFSYMAKVENKIAFPRHSHPKDLIKKGSIGIAEQQTAIYPKDSPGGWNIIAKTPLEIYNKNKKKLSILSVGDRVKFEPITKHEFLKLGGEI